MSSYSVRRYRAVTYDATLDPVSLGRYGSAETAEAALIRARRRLRLADRFDVGRVERLVRGPGGHPNWVMVCSLTWTGPTMRDVIRIEMPYARP